MIINLETGDKLIVQVTDTDDEFRVHFASTAYPNAVVVTATVPDATGRCGELYHKDFSVLHEDKDENLL